MFDFDFLGFVLIIKLKITQLAYTDTYTYTIHHWNQKELHLRLQWQNAQTVNGNVQTVNVSGQNFFVITKKIALIRRTKMMNLVLVSICMRLNSNNGCRLLIVASTRTNSWRTLKEKFLSIFNIFKADRCNEDEFFCGGVCIESEKVCDGKNDCVDFSDEINCPSPPTPPVSHRKSIEVQITWIL